MRVAALLPLLALLASAVLAATTKTTTTTIITATSTSIATSTSTSLVVKTKNSTETDTSTTSITVTATSTVKDTSTIDVTKTSTTTLVITSTSTSVATLTSTSVVTFTSTSVVTSTSTSTAVLTTTSFAATCATSSSSSIRFPSTSPSSTVSTTSSARSSSTSSASTVSTSATGTLPASFYLQATGIAASSDVSQFNGGFLIFDQYDNILASNVTGSNTASPIFTVQYLAGGNITNVLTILSYESTPQNGSFVQGPGKYQQYQGGSFGGMSAVASDYDTENNNPEGVVQCTGGSVGGAISCAFYGFPTETQFYMCDGGEDSDPGRVYLGVSGSSITTNYAGTCYAASLIVVAVS